MKGTSYWSKNPGHGQYLASASDLFDPHPSWGDTLQGLDCHRLGGGRSLHIDSCTIHLPTLGGVWPLPIPGPLGLLREAEAATPRCLFLSLA